MNSLKGNDNAETEKNSGSQYCTETVSEHKKQINLFSSEHLLSKEILSININTTTPLDAVESYQ